MRFTCLLLLLALTACRQAKEKEYLLPSKYAGDHARWQLTVADTSMYMPDGYTNRYYTKSVYMQGNTAYLAGFNPAGPSIDIINISSQQVVRQIMLSKDSLFAGFDKHDLNKSKSITDLVFINFDSLLVNIGNRDIVLMDSALHIKKVINLYQVAAQNGAPGLPISNSGNFSMLYNARTQSILLNQLYADDSIQLKRPMMVWLNLNTALLNYLPLTFSDYFYAINTQAGFLGQIYVSPYQNDSVLTYSYGYESNIYQFNTQRGTITYYGAQSDSCTNLVQPFAEDKNDDGKAWEIHMIENTAFQQVLYDPYRQLYYRFHSKNVPYKNGKYFRGMTDKPLVLMVFNTRFEVLKEIPMPEHLYSAGTAFITPEGLYISPTHPKNKHITANVIPFHIFKMKKT